MSNTYAGGFYEEFNFKIDEYLTNTSDKISFKGSKWASGMREIGFNVEAQVKSGIWEIIKCDMTWIS